MSIPRHLLRTTKVSGVFILDGRLVDMRGNHQRRGFELVHVVRVARTAGEILQTLNPSSLDVELFMPTTRRITVSRYDPEQINDQVDALVAALRDTERERKWGRCTPTPNDAMLFFGV